MIPIKTSHEIDIMREAGKIAADIMNSALLVSVPGTTPLEINNFIEDQMVKKGVTPWFKEVNDYPYASCVAVNEVWIHGMPNKVALAKNDIVSVDIGVRYEGYNIDHCWTISVTGEDVDKKNIRSSFKNENSEVEKFLKTGVYSLNSAIERAIPNGRIGDISSTMQDIVESAGYSVVVDYGGHGIGTDTHEEPHIPCFGSPGAGIKIAKNMTLAIEIMYSMGSSQYNVDKDKWSIVTKDKSLTGMFEHTVAITQDGAEILTK